MPVFLKDSVATDITSYILWYTLIIQTCLGKKKQSVFQLNERLYISLHLLYASLNYANMSGKEKISFPIK